MKIVLLGVCNSENYDITENYKGEERYKAYTLIMRTYKITKFNQWKNLQSE